MGGQEGGTIKKLSSSSSRKTGLQGSRSTRPGSLPARRGPAAPSAPPPGRGQEEAGPGEAGPGAAECEALCKRRRGAGSSLRDRKREKKIKIKQNDPAAPKRELREEKESE